MEQINNHKTIDVESHDPQKLQSILITVCVALMAVIASVSGLNVAQPELAIAFNASQNKVLWIINIYTISLAALLLPLGAVGDRWGRRPILLLGLIIFGAANAAAAMATSADMMFLARLASGVGAAMIMPITLAVITSHFPEKERSKAIGVWTGVAGGGGILGMYLSAVLVDFATWRWLFVLPIVLVIVAFVMTIRFIPNSHERSEFKFDLLGALASVVSIMTIVYALHDAPRWGWSDPSVIFGLFVGVLGLAIFVMIELNHQGPLLDVRLFRERSLSSGSISLLTVFGVQAGIFIVLFPYFQAVLGWSGLRSTLALMPMALLMMLALGLSAKFIARIGKRKTMAIGILLGAIGLLLMASFVSIDNGYLSILPGMLAMGFGMGLSMTPSTEAITTALPHDRQGVASALNDVTRELGTAIGVAWLGSLVAAGYTSTMDEKLTGISMQKRAIAREGIANALELSRSLGSQAAKVVQAAKESFIVGWQQAMWVGATIFTALFIYILFQGPTERKAIEVDEKTLIPQDNDPQNRSEGSRLMV